MPTRWLAHHVTARHGYAIERLKRDMALEEDWGELVDFLASDAANFVWGFLLASGNLHNDEGRALRNDLQRAIATTLAEHGIDQRNFVVRPEINADAPLTRP